jgi:hypothetical protein
VQIVSEDESQGPGGGIVKIFIQCLETMSELIYKLEHFIKDTMGTDQIIEVCERCSLAMWGSAKKQSTVKRADLSFERLSLLCNIVQRFVAL